MPQTDLTSILRRTESETLDFKRDQYLFYGSPPEDKKAELLKDIVAFANAWKDSDAYIVVGVTEEHGRAIQTVGVVAPLNDNDVQQFVNSKTNRPVSFLVETAQHQGVTLTVVKIARTQSRPIYLGKAYGRLQKGVVYIRRGSSTEEASPDEIAEMGREEARAEQPTQVADIVLEVEHAAETWWINSMLPLGPDQRSKPYKVHVLRVYGRNRGTSLAQYVQGHIEFPEAIHWDSTLGEGVVANSVEADETIKFDLTNHLSDPPPNYMARRPPPVWKPILPGAKLELLVEKLVPLPYLLDSENAILKWEVQGDNGPLNEGSIPLSSVPFVDRQTDPNAELG